MLYEKSCGGVIYRRSHGNLEFLLIRHVNSGHWSFPKGHVEDGETEEETALREIKEETGLDVILDTSFREIVSYSPKKDTMKDVVYFIGTARSSELKLQKEEVSEAKWVDFGHAASLLTYENDRAMIGKVRNAIKDRMC